MREIGLGTYVVFMYLASNFGFLLTSLWPFLLSVIVTCFQKFLDEVARCLINSKLNPLFIRPEKTLSVVEVVATVELEQSARVHSGLREFRSTHPQAELCAGTEPHSYGNHQKQAEPRIWLLSKYSATCIACVIFHSLSSKKKMQYFFVATEEKDRTGCAQEKKNRVSLRVRLTVITSLWSYLGKLTLLLFGENARGKIVMVTPVTNKIKERRNRKGSMEGENTILTAFWAF